MPPYRTILSNEEPKLVDKLPTHFRKVLYTHTLFVLKYPQGEL